MSSYADRLKALREQLKAEKLDGFVVPLTDEHMSEYVGSYAQRLAWLTGFQGSAGSAVVLPEQAAIFTDGRYTLQVRQQVSATEWSYQSVPEPRRRVAEGACSGRCPDRLRPVLHTRAWVGQAKEALAARGAELVAVARNPIDSVWTDRPEASKAHLIVQPDQYAANRPPRSGPEIGDWLVKQHAEAASAVGARFHRLGVQHPGAPTSLTPGRARLCIVNADGTAICSFAEEKIGPEVRQHLGNGVRLHDRADFEGALTELSGKTVVVDPERAVRRHFRRSRQGRRHRSSPCAIRLSCPGAEEFRRNCGQKAAQKPRWHRYRPLPQMDRREEAPGGEVDELKASTKLEALRRENPELKDLSFDSISGAGRTAQSSITSRARRPTESGAGDALLIDSGGQYVDGTTDITRTVPIGEPTEEMRDRFTGCQGPYRDRHRGLPERDARDPARQLRPPAVVGGGPRLRPRHRPRCRQLPCRPRRTAADFAGRQLAVGRRRAACRWHDHFQRAPAITRRRIRHPHRESGAGRAARKSTGAEKKCWGLKP